MNNSASRQQANNIAIRSLAPIVQLKTIPKVSNDRKKRVLETKPEIRQPVVYDKPIYKPKKYDLL